MLFHRILTPAFLMAPTYATKVDKVPPFTLSSPAGRDIWRKPPSHNVIDAPTHPSPLPQYDLKSFQRARLSFTLPPGKELRQYDQAGLLLSFTRADAPLGSGKDKWLKTGIEWYYGKPYLSTVGCDAWADWSITPLVEFQGNESRPGATVEARREKDQLGKSLWIYQIIQNERGEEVERRPLREVNWIFAEEEGWKVGVGGAVARPSKDGGEADLTAEFREGVEVEVLDYEREVSG
ncbi:hypothetical protein BU23DRAFT_559671 [Bimuria novae-zelandiae CBS 107.79]|uniref:Uncharacterized protein n=1 Tax=Bimuria novae-zelandiae CBS 107.79 TaxID=1447943 RepID=A0A6A5UQG8_9PLEO|nr:hypothetical protein BU23DRAFT_559671 [Bimuria novae-zelandiae CBS 107.79]